MIAAGLGEEDVAARLGVDTKTVRRWLEGRVPFQRHRWTIATILQVSEVDLWPQLRGDHGRPQEVLAVYPHRDQVPAGVWLRVLGSAAREIGVLARTGMFLAAVPGALELLGARVQAGVRARICLRDPGAPAGADVSGFRDEDQEAGQAAEALGLFGPLRALGEVELRLHGVDHYGCLVFADEELLAVQRVYGIAPGRCPVLHLRRGDEPGLSGSYRDSFERVWSGAGSQGLRPRSP